MKNLFKNDFEYEKMKTLRIITIVIFIIELAAVIIPYVNIIFNLKTPIFVVVINGLLLIVLPLFLLIVSIISFKGFLIIKKIIPYWFICFTLFIAFVGGGVRSISNLLLFLVPFVAFTLEENIPLPSIISLSLFFLLIYFKINPVIDNFIMRYCQYPVNSLFNVNNTYYMMFITIFISIFIFSLFFRRENNRFKKSIENKNKKIISLSQNKINFFINLAHETKTPLTLISNYLDKDIKKRGKSEDIEIVKENINKLENDMVNYLDLEKLDREQFFYNHNKIIDLSNMLKVKILMFNEIADKKNIKISSDIKDFIYIKIDPSAMDRILNNILDNAVKYTNESGKINVILESDYLNLSLIVKDTGIGIHKDQQKYIFEPLHQISHEKRNIQGIGMGLNIVKKIVDEVNGKIEVESESGKGSTFIITLKKHNLKDNEKLYEVKQEKPKTKNTNIKLQDETYDKYSSNILIVEDNKEMLSYLQDELKSKYNIFYALNGKEALEKLEKIRKPDLIISDIMMDEMDGYEFYENLIKEEKFRTIPFIFLTAKTGADDKLEGIKKGAVDYISKPFNIEELKAKVGSLINVQDALRIERLEELSEDLYDYLVRKKVKKELDLIENEKFSKLEKIFNDYKISKRQIEIISLIKEGKERKEIADVLGISEGTIRTQMDRIYKKCDVNNKVELANLFRV